jgi:hypothetical protein
MRAQLCSGARAFAVARAFAISQTCEEVSSVFRITILEL